MAPSESGTIAILAEKPSVARDIARVLGAVGRAPVARTLQASARITDVLEPFAAVVVSMPQIGDPIRDWLARTSGGISNSPGTTWCDSRRMTFSRPTFTRPRW